MGDEFQRRVLNPDGTPRSLINIYINGKNMRFGSGMQTPLKDGDEVYILPAVAGGSELSSRDLERYSRQVMLEEIGYEGQLKLKNAKICVVGVGGLGNPIATRLVAMGIGKIRIVDRDVIELSNLHRQTMFDESDIGQIKVEAARSSGGENAVIGCIGREAEQRSNLSPLFAVWLECKMERGRQIAGACRDAVGGDGHGSSCAAPPLRPRPSRSCARHVRIDSVLQ